AARAGGSDARAARRSSSPRRGCRSPDRRRGSSPLAPRSGARRLAAPRASRIRGVQEADRGASPPRRPPRRPLTEAQAALLAEASARGAEPHGHAARPIDEPGVEALDRPRQLEGVEPREHLLEQTADLEPRQVRAEAVVRAAAA